MKRKKVKEKFKVGRRGIVVGKSDKRNRSFMYENILSTVSVSGRTMMD